MKRKEISKPLNSRNRNNNLCTGGAKNITTSFYGFWVFDSRSIKAITSNGKYSNATIQVNHKLTFGCLMFLAADPLTRTLNSGFTFVRFNIKIYRQRWMDFSWNTFFLQRGSRIVLFKMAVFRDTYLIMTRNHSRQEMWLHVHRSFRGQWTSLACIE